MTRHKEVRIIRSGNDFLAGVSEPASDDPAGTLRDELPQEYLPADEEGVLDSFSAPLE